MRPLLWVPVLVGVVSHVGGRGAECSLVGSLHPAGGLQHCGTLVICVAAVAAAAAVVAAVAVVGGGGVAAAVVAVVVTVAAVFPHSWRRGGVTGHGITGVWTVFQSDLPQGELSVLVELLKFGATVLEPDFDLKK